jgi:hypothetical protein
MFQKFVDSVLQDFTSVKIIIAESKSQVAVTIQMGHASNAICLLFYLMTDAQSMDAHIMILPVAHSVQILIKSSVKSVNWIIATKQQKVFASTARQTIFLETASVLLETLTAIHTMHPVFVRGV